MYGYVVANTTAMRNVALGFIEIEGFRPPKKGKESFLVGCDLINRVVEMDRHFNHC